MVKSAKVFGIEVPELSQEHIDNLKAIKGEADAMLSMGTHGAITDMARRFSLMADALLAVIQQVVTAQANQKAAKVATRDASIKPTKDDTKS